MSGIEWLFRMRMLVSGPCGVASGRAPRPMPRTGSEVIGMALCLPVEGFLILHHFGEAPAHRTDIAVALRGCKAGFEHRMACGPTHHRAVFGSVL